MSLLLPTDGGPRTHRSRIAPWKSTGWTNNHNVTQLLEFMVLRGEVAVAGRHGGDRLWDLATRVYLDEPAVPVDEALRIRNERRLPAGDVQARCPASVGVTSRYRSCTATGWWASSMPPPTAKPGCAGPCNPRGRSFQQDDDRSHRSRDQGPGSLARAGPRAARLSKARASTRPPGHRSDAPSQAGRTRVDNLQRQLERVEVDQ
jgi:hypothetical protein